VGTVDPVTVTVAVNVTDVPAGAGFSELVTVVVDDDATAVIVSVSTDEVEVANVASPEYVAVILCGPVLNDDVVYVATNPVIGWLPSSVAPSKNETVPVGVPVAVVATVAVNVTDVPAATDAAEVVNATVVAGLVIVSVSGDDVTVGKFTSPP